MSSLQLVGGAALAGIGLTVALFIAELSFDPPLLGESKRAILAASLAAGTAGLTILTLAGRSVVRSAHPG